jgi:hypothetical protein
MRFNIHIIGPDPVEPVVRTEPTADYRLRQGTIYARFIGHHDEITTLKIERTEP